MLLRTCRVLVAGLLSTALAAGPSSAATVSNEGGTILVSTGDGFEPIASFKELPPGGRVMVKSGGLATITYTPSCSVRVGTGLWLVQDKAPCREGTVLLDFTGRMGDGLGSIKDAPPEPPPPPRVHHDLLILGGVVAGGLWPASFGGAATKTISLRVHD